MRKIESGFYFVKDREGDCPSLGLLIQHPDNSISIEDCFGRFYAFDDLLGKENATPLSFDDVKSIARVQLMIDFVDNGLRGLSSGGKD